MRLGFLIVLGVLAASNLSSKTLAAEPEPTTSPTPAPSPTPKKWYDSLALRGYTQIRYNRLLETNSNLRCEQCDRSWGNNNHFFIRRARLILFGNVHERVYVYIQPDFASDASTGNNHFAQLRDAYFDLALDPDRQFRFRFGQSKIPFGFENLQSSQNRLPLDRADSLNSALPNERDLGLMFYWAPAPIRDRFRHLVESGLKGSGDYGVIGLGIYNGQTPNRSEANNNLHTVARVSYPFQLGNGQFIEPGLQAYRGLYSVTSTNTGVGGSGAFYTDERVAASFVFYPQPFGFQAEGNIGRGPTYLPESNSIESRKLYGGYAMLMYRWTNMAGTQMNLTPFIRAQYFDGGKKHETDARAYNVRDIDLGAEWQPIPAFELTAQYVISRRRFEDLSTEGNFQTGNVLRLQAQFNY